MLRAIWRLLAISVLLVACTYSGLMTASALAAPARVPAATATWGNAKVVTGPGGAPSAMDVVSCSGPGDCEVGGEYGNASGGQAFVLAESGGVWGKAQPVPGLAALNRGGLAVITTMSCTGKGNCAIGGGYSSPTINQEQAFIDDETNGTWAKAREVPGTGKLNGGSVAGVSSLSCASPGNCVAGGSYTKTSGAIEAFLATERNGTWAGAQEVPGTAKLNAGGNAQIISVSCPAAHNCAAIGNYSATPSGGEDQAFLINESNGVWGSAHAVPGLAALEGGGTAYISSVSCPAAGSCGAVGTYWNGQNIDFAFVVNETRGAWGDAKKLPGTAYSGNGYCDAGCQEIDCPATGDCTAVGGVSGGQGFVADESNGAWGHPQEIPNIAKLNRGKISYVNAVSCGSPGHCSVIGNYVPTMQTPIGDTRAFVADEAGGTWGNAQEMPGTASLARSGGVNPVAVSCASATSCTAIGSSQAGGWVAGMPGS